MAETPSVSTQPVPVRAITHGGAHFFGYYDKCPWSVDGRRLLAMRAPFQDRPPGERDRLTIGIVDLASGRFDAIAETTAWSWQQGTMLQWLPDGQIIYNARRADGSLAAVIHDPATGRKRELPRPIYDVNPNGLEAMSLDFHRLQTLRPGYGYPPGIELTAANLSPDDVGLWRMDLRSGECKLVLSIAAARAIGYDVRSDGVPNWFNHINYNTDGSRICFLHRYKDSKGPAGPWQTRLFTLRPDGSEVYLLNGRGACSHFSWRDPRHLLAWTWHPGRTEPELGYWLMTDQTPDATRIGQGVLTRDGHMTYSPDRQWLLTDEYPGPDGKQPLLLFNLASGERYEIGRFAAPLRGELRCDLHARWSRAGREICFDSAHSGERQIYVADVSSIVAGQVR